MEGSAFAHYFIVVRFVGDTYHQHLNFYKMKKAIVLGSIIICIGLSYFYPHAMISPGELLTEHQELNKKCMSCHSIFSGVPDDKCISCHKVSDIGKDSLNKKGTGRFSVLFHQYLSGQKCTSCHTDHKGMVPDSLLTGFKHELLTTSLMNKCVSCHSKPVDTLHQFLTASCAGCHNTKGWKSSVKFDHAMIQGTDKNNCTSCHQKPADDYHQLLTTGCDKCHSNSKWIPSTFDHSAYFQLDKHHTTKCNTCHSNNNFSVYTCYGCHEHSESEMISEHSEEGIYKITNCASCHKSGNEHDIKMNGQSGEGAGKQEANKVKDYIESPKKSHGEEKEN